MIGMMMFARRNAEAAAVVADAMARQAARDAQAHRGHLSRRLGPVFAEVAEQARGPRMEDHKAAYRARPIEDRLHGFTHGRANGLQSNSYKPVHGGYPG